MVTPTILFLNNRYVNSLEELKAYFSSKLNEAQKGELIAAFRDKVLYNWLNEGGGTEKHIASDMQSVLDQHLGNGEVLKKIAELFGVPSPWIADYKFADYAEYLGCCPIVHPNKLNTSFCGRSETKSIMSNVVECAKEISSAFNETVLDTLCENRIIPKEIIPDGGIIHLKKGSKIIKLLLVFKIVTPENDFLSLHFSVNQKKEKIITKESLKLNLEGEKNSLKSITLEIDGEKLCKDCTLTVFHGDILIGRVNIDNHENTDKDIEATEDTLPDSFHKTKIVARVRTKKGYGFYDEDGRLVLKPELQLLKNDMYPDNGEFEFGFYYKEVVGKKQLFHVDKEGYAFLGEFKDTILLSENKVAVCKGDTNFYGIIDKNGGIVLEANKYGKIKGISKDGFMVCEVQKDIWKLVYSDGKCFEDDKNFTNYIVNPNTNLVCGLKEKVDGRLQLWCNRNRAKNFYKIGDANSYKQYSFFVFDDFVILERMSNKKNLVVDIMYGKLGNNGDSYTDLIIKRWKKQFLYTEKGVYCIKNDNCFNDEASPLLSVKEDVFYGGVFSTATIKENKPVYIDLIAKDDNTTINLFSKSENGENNEVLESYQSRCAVSLLGVVSYCDLISVYYTTSIKKEIINHTIILDSHGKKREEDHLENFAFLCGPFEDGCFSFLKEGELYRKTNGGKVMQLSTNLGASELWPLSATGNFLVKIMREGHCEYQIIDNHGAKLGEPFSAFGIHSSDCRIPNAVMDFICNSKYISIKNSQGAFGLIDTDGKVIVPCMYDEVEELDSVFKREGIAIF